MARRHKNFIAPKAVEIEQRTSHLPFLEITNAHFEAMYVDWRRIALVRGANKDTESERHANAVILIDGLPHPLNVDDSPDFIMDMIAAAGGDASFITLAFGVDYPVYVQNRYIVGLKGYTEIDDGALVYIDGYPNDGDKGAQWSIQVTNNVDEILKMIRHANPRS